MVMRMPNVRMRWWGEKGWLVFAPTALTEMQLKRIAEWAEKHQIDRWRGLPPGDRKTECHQTILDLRAGHVRCVVQNDEGAVFASTERTRPDRAIFVMGEEGQNG